MAFMTDNDRTRIRDAIGAAEKRTSGELVTVVAGASDDYYYIPTLWAAVLALLVPTGLFLAGLLPGVEALLAGQMGGFIALALLFQWTPLKMRLVPRAVREERAGRLAREMFFECGLHKTRNATAILIFVSVAERYVEILADHGIDEKVDPAIWQTAVAAITHQVKAGRVADGFVKAIADCGGVLAEHFPAGHDDVNELPDRLIEI